MTNPTEIAEFWRKEYSSGISEYDPFRVTNQFKRIATLFTPGTSYFYIMNVHNLELDYISSEVELITGLEPQNVTIEKLLKTALPKELEWVKKKELVVKDFYGRFLPKKKITEYKLVYSYRMKDQNNKKRVILHQAIPLSTTDNGIIKHVLSIHTDITHLTNKSTTTISFIDLEGRNSYYNVPTLAEHFNPQLSNSGPNAVFRELTEREQEILNLVAKGLSAKQIAGNLNLSEHTVKTHRKNILKKSKCNNTAELVAESMIAGLVN